MLLPVTGVWENFRETRGTSNYWILDLLKADIDSPPSDCGGID